MSQDLASLYIKVDSTGVVTASKNLDDFNKTAGKTEVAAKKVTTATASMVKGWMSVAAITATVISIMKQSVQAFMDAEKAELKMAMALKNQGEYSKANITTLKEYAAEIQKVTAYEDDLVLSVMANMKTYGMSNEVLKRATQVALDFATAKQAEGMTISTAAELLGKAYAGNTAMLSRYGIVIDDSLKKGEKFNAVLLQLEQRFGDSAQAQLLTYSGQWAKMKNQWGDIAEFLGLYLLKILQLLNVAVGALTNDFLWMGDKVLAVLNLLLTPLFKILEAVGWVADKLGLKGVSLVMEGITTSIDNARGAVQAAKSDTVAWTKANFENLKSFEKIDDAVSKMKPGQRTKQDFGEGATGKAAAKSSKDIQEDLRAELGLLLNVEDAYYATEQAIQAMADAGDEAAEAVKKLLAEDYAKAMAGINADSQSDYQNKMDAIIAEEQKRFDAIDLMRITDQENEKQYLADKAKAHTAAAKKIADIEQKKIKEQMDMVADSLGNIRELIDGISSLYDQGSKSAGQWTAITNTLALAQKGLAITNAVVAVTNQGSGDVYTAFYRVTAMLAFMGSILSTIGASVSGGGGASASSYKAKSTALGSDEQSTSLTNSYELLRDTYDMQYERLSKLYDEMRDVNKNLGNMAASLLRTGSLEDSLTIGKQSIGDLLSGKQSTVISSNFDQIINSWMTRKPIQGTAIDSSTTALFSNTFKKIGESIIEIAQSFGVDTNKVLDETFGEIRINTQKLTGEELTKKLNEKISTATDKVITNLFGKIIENYQKVGESLLDTALRLVTDKEVVLTAMEKVNSAFVGTTENAIAFSEALISAAGDLDALTSAIDTYYDKFFSDAEKQTNTVKQLTEALAAYGYTLPATREAFRALVESIDAVADPQKYYDIIKLAGSMDEMFSYMEEAADAAAEAADEAFEKMKDALRAEIELKKDAYTEAYNLQREALQNELSILTGYYEKLKSARESMQINDAQSQGMIFSTAKFQLSKLLREVRGGKLSGLETADDMLKTLTSISPEQYSTRTEYLKDYNNIYNSISEMEKITGSKKDAQQQQIDLLQATYDMQMEAFQAQLDAIDTMTNATKEVGDIIWIACGWLAKYQAGEISYSEMMTHRAYANGGTGTGWNIVGEKGMELANFGTGSQVYSNSDTKKIFNSDGIISSINSLGAKVDKQAKDNKAFKDDILKLMNRWEGSGIKERAA